ncbi:hypothetical protein HGA64_04115, partial [Candidatus Falkowbacteria bacterium]|nr:hypothetical protein [Candidatus Falkowbacteria bacterium]
KKRIYDVVLACLRSFPGIKVGEIVLLAYYESTLLDTLEQLEAWLMPASEQSEIIRQNLLVLSENLFTIKAKILA